MEIQNNNECKVSVTSPQKGEWLKLVPPNQKCIIKWSHPTCSYPNLTVQIDLLKNEELYGIIENDCLDNGEYKWPVGSYRKDGRPKTATSGKYQIKISIKSNGILTKCTGTSEIFNIKLK